MELLLSVTHPAPDGPRRADVTVELDALTPIGALHEALGRYLGTDAPVLARGPGPVVLDPDRSVFDAGVVSGDHLHLLDAPPAAAPGPGDGTGVALDVTSGPGTGRSVLLRPGRYEVGRDPACAVPFDDPTMSGRHLVIEVHPDLTVTVDPSPQAANGTLVDGEPIDGPVTVGPDQTVAAGNTALAVRPGALDTVGRRDRLGQIGFNRLPYRRPVVHARVLDELDPPPEKPSPRRFSLVSVLLPAVAAAAIVAVTGNAIYLVFAGLSPVMMVANYLSEGKHSKRSYAQGRQDFLERVERRAADLEAAVAAERAERFEASPDIPTLARQARARSSRLWERHRGSPDVLDLRLGLGDRPTEVQSRIRASGDPELREAATGRLAFHRTAQLVPVTVDLDGAGVTGIYGEPDAVRAVGAALAVQAACLHSPEDLVLTAALPAGDEARWRWLAWLPHTRAVTSPLDGPHLVGPGGVDDLVVRLLAVADHRLGGPGGDAGRAWPRVLAVLHDQAGADRSLLASLLDVAPAAGIDVLWLGHAEHQAPRQCQALVSLAPDLAGYSTLWFTDPERERIRFEAAGVTVEVAEAVARSLAPVRDLSGRSGATAIPRVVPLLDVLALPTPTAAAVAARWDRPRGDGLAAAVGLGADGPVTLDLVHQGPHALVGGTSGSGKSELLQTLVLALAADHPPERLTFLFIDYKGGASSAGLAALPHTVGQVTNLDERLSLRALASLRAELQRRMAVLEGRAKDLAEMRRVAPDEAPPSLVIVCDEFATLVKEIPDFVAGIVDIAQRGRSLGIHLVLATQRPSGAVNDNILANTNLRVALRVLDAADSTSIIGARDAADIPVPLRGRAFARTGPGALVAFQSAWSGAPHRAAVQAEPVTVEPFTAAAGDVPDLRAPAAAPAGDGDAPTQLQVLVEACRGAAALRDRPPPARPWVEPLPDQLTLDAVTAPVAAALAADPGRRVVIGLADDPESQAQHPVVVDLEATGGLIVFGGGGAGKTTLLRTIAAGAAGQGGADGVVVYGLDFAGRSLAAVEDLPQTAAVATNDEIERVTRLLTVLQREIDDRRRLLAAARAESLSALRRQRGDLVVPRLLVLLDGYPGFHATFDQGPLYTWITELQRVVTEGRPVGIHVVVTTTRQLGVPSALLSALGARVVLRLANPDDLLALGVPRDVAQGAELPDGRGFIDGRTELQVATVSAEPAGAAQAAAIAALGADLRRRGAVAAAPLPELPDVLPLDTLPAPGPPLRPWLGAADLSPAPVAVDLVRQNLVVVGGPLSGRSATLATVARGVAAGRAAAGAGPRLVGVGGAVSPLAKETVWDRAGFGRAAAAGTLRAVAEEVRGDEGDEVRLVVVVDGAEDVEAAENGAALEALARSDAVRLVVAIEPATFSRAYSGWTAELKTNRTVVHLQPSSAAEVEALAGVRPVLRPGQAFPPGRGVLVDRRSARLVHVARPDGYDLVED